MSFSVSWLIISALFGITLSQNYDGTATATGTDIQIFSQIKNCSQEAIYYFVAGFNLKCIYNNKPICVENWKKCQRENGYDTEAPEEICKREVGPNFVVDNPPEYCDVAPSNYLNFIQTNCCTKSKLKEQFPDRSFAETQDILENCYDKVNCPGNDSCTANTPN